MANRNFPQSRQWSNHMMPVSYDTQIAIGATGAPTIATGNGYGIASITRLSAGKYRLQLQDNFTKLLQFKCFVQSPTSGTPVAAGSLSVGTVYQIISLGTTTQAQWITAGVPNGITAAPGVTFKCAATSTGTGSSQTLVTSGIAAVEIMGSNANMLNYRPNGTQIQNQGGFIDFQTMAPSFVGESYTPAGTISRGNIPVTAGTAGDAVTNNAGALNSTGGQDLTVDLQSLTGTAHTLAGTIAMTSIDPVNGSALFIEIIVSNSSVQ